MDYRFTRRPKKVRVNVSLYPDVLHAMTRTAKQLGCSRSELIEYAWHFWESANLDVVEKAVRG